MEVIRRMTMIMHVTGHQRHDFAAAEPRGDIAVIVTADAGDRGGADQLAAVILGNPNIWCAQVPHLLSSRKRWQC